MVRRSILSRIHDITTRIVFGKESMTDREHFYDLVDTDMLGNEVPMASFEGDVLLCVNVASKCGLTHRNYTQLTALVDMYGPHGFRVLAFPCNQFTCQEPGTYEEILSFSEKYNAREKFTWFSKAHVNGGKVREVYSFLKQAIPNKDNSLDVRWNFAMFLVDHTGIPYKRFGPLKDPFYAREYIEELLRKKIDPPPESGPILKGNKY